MQWIEIFAVVFSLIYVILAARNIIWCWLAAIVSVILFGWLTYENKLYAEVILQVYYLVMAFYGWVNWNRHKDQSSSSIIRWKWQKHLMLVAVGIVAFIAAGFVLGKYSDANVPYFDAFTTVFSVIATFLTARKVLENWLYWIIIDSASIFLYLGRGLELTAGLFAGYTVAAVWGFFYWRKLSAKSNETS